MVGKCDMCHERLADGDAPACVDACPSEALAIEIVDVQQWRETYRDEANAPGLPSADDTVSTTRVTLPDDLPLDAERADSYRVRPAKPHYSLVLMTVLTQISVAAFATVWMLSLLGGLRFARDRGSREPRARPRLVRGIAAAPGPTGVRPPGDSEPADIVAEQGDREPERLRRGGGRIRAGARP